MVRFCVLNGPHAGTLLTADRFPCTLGRAADDTLRFTEAGVWDRHLQLTRELPTGFHLHRLGAGRASRNGEAFDSLILRQGDIIELGAVKLQFWLGDVQQADNRSREVTVWVTLAALVILQAMLLAFLL